MNAVQYVEEARRSLEKLRILRAIAKCGADQSFSIDDVCGATGCSQLHIARMMAEASICGMLVIDEEDRGRYRLTDEGRASLRDISKMYNEMLAEQLAQPLPTECLTDVTQQITAEDDLAMAWESIGALESKVSSRELRLRFTAIFAEAQEASYCDGDGEIGVQARRIQELVLKYAHSAQQSCATEDDVDAIRVAFLKEVKALRAG